MKKNMLFSVLLFIGLSFSLMASDNSTNITESFRNIEYSNTNMTNKASNSFANETLFARRSGGRSGGRGFSSRSRSRSTSRSTGSSGFSRRANSRTTRSRSNSYSPRRRSGSNYVYVGGGSRYGRSSGGGSFFGILMFLIIVGVIIFFVIKAKKNAQNSYAGTSMTNESFTPIKVQFGLHALAEGFKNDIKRLANSLSYDSDEDMKALVSETAMLLISNQEYVKYANVFQGTSTRDLEKAETDYDNLINEERKKLSQETFQNRGGSILTKSLSDENQPDFMDTKEYFIISLIVSYSSRKIEITDNYDWSSYEKILDQLASIPGSQIVAAEIVWSPDADGDVLTEDDITMYYPEMKQV